MQFETPIKLAVSALGTACALAALGLAQEAPSAGAGSPLQPVRTASQESSPNIPGVPLRPFAGSDMGTPAPSASQDQPAIRDGDLENHLRQRLSLTDLDARMDAFQDVAQKAAIESAVRKALQSIADDQADVDLAFSARLALREADRIGTWGRAGTAFGGQGLRQPQDPMEAMQRQLDQIFGQDPFLNGAFKNDPFFNRPFGGRAGRRSGGIGIDPFGAGDPFEELEKRVEEMRRRMNDARTGQFNPGTGGFTVTPRGGMSRSSSTSVSITPDGIRVEVIEDNGDGPKKTTYEAPSKEELLELHPELKDRLR